MELMDNLKGSNYIIAHLVMESWPLLNIFQKIHDLLKVFTDVDLFHIIDYVDVTIAEKNSPKINSCQKLQANDIILQKPPQQSRMFLLIIRFDMYFFNTR